MDGIKRTKEKEKYFGLAKIIFVMMLNSGIWAMIKINNNAAAIRNEHKYATKNEVNIQYVTFRSNRIIFKGLKNIKKKN